MIEWLTKVLPCVFGYLADNHLGLVGIVVSTGGFWLTLNQVRQAKTVANRTEIAVSKLKQELNNFEIATEIASSIAALEEIRRHHLQMAWAILPDRYSATRRLLVHIKAHLDAPEHLSAIQSITTNLRRIEERIIKALHAKQEPKGLTELHKALSNATDRLSKIQIDLRTQIGG